MVLLAAMGTAGLIAALSLAGFAYLSGDFGPFCIGIAPWGFAMLVANVLTYRECRKRFESGTISRPAARYVSLEALSANGIPMLVAFAAIVAGLFYGSRNDEWMGELTGTSFLLGAGAMVLIFFPFNALGVLESSLTTLFVRRQKRWPYDEKAA